MVAGVAAFCVVDGRTGRALYEADFGSTRRDDARHLRQFVIASSLDRLNERKWETHATYVKIIDTFDADCFIHAYVTQGNIHFVLLTTKREEQNVKQFFETVHEATTKVRMSPFFYDDSDDHGLGEMDWLAANASFDAKVRRCSRVLG
jgi:hypothetical protein